MRVVELSIVGLSLLLLAAPASAGLPDEVCCACLVEADARSGAASFCELVPFVQASEFETRCEAAGGGSTLCVRTHDLECLPRFAEIDIACNASAVAPLLGPSALAGMALALAALGIGVIRRRGRPVDFAQTTL